MSATTPAGLSKERLDEIVQCLETAIADEGMRKASQRAVQAKVWHQEPKVAAFMADLRRDEEEVRMKILSKISSLVYRFHEHTLDVTLARAGIITDNRVHRGSLLEKREEFDVFCLDAKERLYLILKQYNWFSDFFRLYPQHFYENSFMFVDNIPDKKLKVKVKVVGLGIAGSMALSGLARAGVDSAVGYEKRDKSGPRGVGTRYQNASWRAYDIAERLLDQEAYEHLIAYRQRLNVTLDDGTTKIVTSDRVQIILGDAVDTALSSAERCGAEIHFGSNIDDFYNSNGHTSQIEDADIVALFAGAHAASFFPGMDKEMHSFSWPELSSTCKMWLRIKESKHSESFTTRGGEIGAEKWHYSIESSRNTVEDILRVKGNLINQYQRSVQKTEDGSEEKKEVDTKYEAQLGQIESVLKSMEENKDARFDYLFTNAPANDHNLAKRAAAGEDGSVVIDGGYTVDIKIACNSKIDPTSPTAKDLLNRFSTKVIVTGGDACVPPNPLAAYGATLACEAADMVVQLAVGHGHLNSILEDMETMMLHEDNAMEEEWKSDVQELKDLLSEFYNARGRSENYFQWVQTLICNLYSLPPMVS